MLRDLLCAIGIFIGLFLSIQIRYIIGSSFSKDGLSFTDGWRIALIISAVGTVILFILMLIWR